MIHIAQAPVTTADSSLRADGRRHRMSSLPSYRSCHYHSTGQRVEMKNAIDEEMAFILATPRRREAAH